jgi:CRP/FNR family transcriptional regulator, cyclic AMP receptor protein
MGSGDLGKLCKDGEQIVRQGDTGDCMYVVLQGEVEVLLEEAGGEQVLSTLKAGDIFGEMALFSREPRSATVRAKGEARVLTVDRQGFMKRIHKDPSLAFAILDKMSERIRRLDTEIVRLQNKAKP